jgi:hypothetical protein
MTSLAQPSSTASASKKADLLLVLCNSVLTSVSGAKMFATGLGISASASSQFGH